MRAPWCLLALVCAGSLRAETVQSDTVGEVSIYRGEGKEFVLFLSGDGGWSLGVLSMAQHLADEGATVAGIDIRRVLRRLEDSKDACVSPAAELDALSHELQQKLNISPYRKPVIVGFSSGATLVYVALAEAEQSLFKGALSLGFCPDLDLLKPVCPGAGIGSTPRHDAKGTLKGVDFLAAKKLSGRWISLQGELDQVCPAPAAVKFIAQVPGGEAVPLPKVGHGYSVERNWVPQFQAAFRRLTHEP
jgi:pimeloyl-ACP methyl ester carboxylesterase